MLCHRRNMKPKKNMAPAAIMFAIPAALPADVCRETDKTKAN